MEKRFYTDQGFVVFVVFEKAEKIMRKKKSNLELEYARNLPLTFVEN